jgi:hypothetical protein
MWNHDLDTFRCCRVKFLTNLTDPSADKGINRHLTPARYFSHNHACYCLVADRVHHLDLKIVRKRSETFAGLRFERFYTTVQDYIVESVSRAR